MISVKQLRYFSAVAHSGHFGVAAERCGVSQPALSMQVQELERELGIALIERASKGARLTAEGAEIARRATRILADISDLLDYGRHCQSLLAGQLRLGVIPTVAPYLLPPLLPVVREAYPDLELHLRETQTQSLVRELLDGELDLLLLALPVEHAGIETVALYEDRFLLAMPKSRRIAGGARAMPELLRNDRLLLLEEGHCLRDQALAFCHLRQVDNIDTFGASSLTTIVQMVANGMGLTLLPEISLDLELRQAEVHVERFKEPQPSRMLGLAWRASSPRKRDFAELARLIAAARPGQGRRTSFQINERAGSPTSE